MNRGSREVIGGKFNLASDMTFSFDLRFIDRVTGIIKKAQRANVHNF